MVLWRYRYIGSWRLGLLLGLILFVGGLYAGPVSTRRQQLSAHPGPEVAAAAALSPAPRAPQGRQQTSALKPSPPTAAQRPARAERRTARQQARREKLQHMLAGLERRIVLRSAGMPHRVAKASADSTRAQPRKPLKPAMTGGIVSAGVGLLFVLAGVFFLLGTGTLGIAVVVLGGLGILLGFILIMLALFNVL